MSIYAITIVYKYGLVCSPDWMQPWYSLKVDVPKLNIAIIWTPVFEWLSLGVDLRTDTKNAFLSNRLEYITKIC